MKEAILILAGKQEGTKENLERFINWNQEKHRFFLNPTEEKMSGYKVYKNFFWKNKDAYSQLKQINYKVYNKELALYVLDQEVYSTKKYVYVRSLDSEEDSILFVRVEKSIFEEMKKQCKKDCWIEAENVKIVSEKKGIFNKNSTWKIGGKE